MRVSIITACLNAQDELRRTMVSVKQQTYQNREHVIVDGASTDGTPGLLGSTNVDARWLSEPDTGIANAMNKALRIATGDYVLTLHAGDEFLSSDSLAEAIPHLTGEDFISFDVVCVSGTGERRRLSASQAMRRLHLKLPFPHQGCFIKRSLFDRIGLYDETYKITMDYELMLRAFRLGTSYRHIPEVVSAMPENGISTRRDWISVKARLADEQRLQRRHLRKYGRLIYAAYWFLYMPYKRMRSR